jgi:hypothetical protein
MTWLVFALLTVVSWGVYGVFLHTGQTSMGGDPSLARYKAFLFVGIAYFLTAVLAPLLLLMTKGAAFSGYSSKGMWWSLIAGIVGAIGAFGVLLAFGAGGKPGIVMSIVFRGCAHSERDSVPGDAPARRRPQQSARPVFPRHPARGPRRLSRDVFQTGGPPKPKPVAVAPAKPS